MTYYGPITIGFDYPDPRLVRVTCTDDRRGTFVDVLRAGKQPTDRRFELEPGQTIELEVAPGEVTIAFGANTRADIVQDDGP